MPSRTAAACSDLLTWRLPSQPDKGRAAEELAKTAAATAQRRAAEELAKSAATLMVPSKMVASANDKECGVLL